MVYNLQESQGWTPAKYHGSTLLGVHPILLWTANLPKYIKINC